MFIILTDEMCTNLHKTKIKGLPTDVVAPEVLERDVAVPAAEQVEVLPMQDAGVLASRSGNPVFR